MRPDRECSILWMVDDARCWCCDIRPPNGLQVASVPPIKYKITVRADIQNWFSSSQPSTLIQEKIHLLYILDTYKAGTTFKQWKISCTSKMHKKTKPEIVYYLVLQFNVHSVPSLTFKRVPSSTYWQSRKGLLQLWHWLQLKGTD